MKILAWTPIIILIVAFVANLADKAGEDAERIDLPYWFGIVALILFVGFIAWLIWGMYYLIF